MRKTRLFYLAGFAVRARSRDKAVRKFIRHGFAAFVAFAETRLVTREDSQPVAYLED